jgi:hypothetical protein
MVAPSPFFLFFFLKKIFNRYSGGTPCHNGQYTRSLHIEFECPFDAVTNQALPGVMDPPKFLLEDETCQYHFRFPPTTRGR